jgi:hypothetical protein
MGRRGPVLAALLGAVASLPALWLPFLADDWANLASVSQSVFEPTAFGYVRPLYLASFRLEWMLFGAAPVPYHLTNLVLVAATAALVVVIVRRYTGDAVLAGLTGVLFALHPYHVENTAWIAGRSDTMFAALYAAAVLTWDRWRESARGLPLATLLLFSAGLLSKESAATLPVFLLFVGLCDRGRRPTRAEWLRGFAPLIAIALAWFLVFRPLALQESGFGFVSRFGLGWLRNLVAFGATGILPPHSEIFEARPLAWLALSGLVAAMLVVLALRGAGRVPRIAWVCVPAFVILLGASVLSFQARYLFLPSAAAALALAALLRAAGPAVGTAAGVLLLSGWTVSAVDHWIGWQSAGIASRALVADLVEASRDPGIGEIALANAPHRVRGAPVFGRLDAAVGIAGGRRVAVTTATLIDYRTPTRDALDGPAGLAVGNGELRLRVRDEPYSRYVYPAAPADGGPVVGAAGTVAFDPDDPAVVRVSLEPRAGRAAYYWSSGRLVPLPAVPSGSPRER